MGDLSFSQQRRPSAVRADSVSARSALRYPDRFGNACSHARARPSRIPVWARDAAGQPEHIGPPTEAEPPAVRLRPSQIPVWPRDALGRSKHVDPLTEAEPPAVDEGLSPAVGVHTDGAAANLDNATSLPSVAHGSRLGVPRWAQQVETAVDSPSKTLSEDLVSSLAPGRTSGSPVRLHVNPVSTASLGAAGYAFGRDIVVGDRADVRSDTIAGRRLLVHQLAHATAADGSSGPPTRVSDHGDAAEAYARSAAAGTADSRRGSGSALRVAPGTVCCFGSDEHKALGDAAFAGA